jgi:hypothetical protein
LAAKKKTPGKKKAATPKGPFYIYLVRKVPALNFDADEDNKDPHKLEQGHEVLSLIIGGLTDMKACEKWLRDNGLNYNGERIIISHRKVDKTLKLSVRTTLGFE